MKDRTGTKKTCDRPRQAHSLRILLVEDHADTRVALATLLKALGHHVKLAQNMRETLLLAAAENENFDLLLSDLGLPDGDGWELLRQLAERDRRPTRAIAVSGWSSKEDFLRSKAAGFEEHLIKPLAPGVLEETLRATAEALN